MSQHQHTAVRPLRVGLIGCGKMGQQHLKAIAGLPGVTVVGIADPLTSREQIEGMTGADAKIYAAAGEMLAEARPDVVHIVTPPHTHADLARLALEAGCHVYVEKPFTPTRREAESVLTLAAARGLQVCPGHQYLCERPAVEARARLAEIGRVAHIESVFSFRMVRRTITPADQAIDILPHAVYPLVDQMRAATGSRARIEVRALEARADGDVYALLALGSCMGVLIVTLSGRPVEQYQHIIGTNGSLRADYIIGGVVHLAGPGAGLGVLFTPFRRSLQTLRLATANVCALLTRKHGSYPGLRALVGRFYDGIRSGAPAVSPESILDTVEICERVGNELQDAERQSEAAHAARLRDLDAQLPPVSPDVPSVLLTGGTGLLGKRVAEELRHAGSRVRVLARRVPRASARIAGVDYREADLAAGVDPRLLDGMDIVVHCAAETAGGKQEHERNSVAATENIARAAAAAGIRRFVHVSSLAVLTPGSSLRRPLDERSPVDAENIERGPYVWGKAASEIGVQALGETLGLAVKVVRPGPLVDYTAFQPPGRLGREVGPWFVAIGPKRAPLSVCDVGTAARALRFYAHHFDAAPPIVNLIEAPPPTRAALAQRLAAGRPDLRFLWVPARILRALSGPAKLAQRSFLGAAKPLDLYSAFASEFYRTDLAADVLRRAGDTAVREPVPEHELPDRVEMSKA